MVQLIQANELDDSMQNHWEISSGFLLFKIDVKGSRKRNELRFRSISSFSK